MKIEVFFEGNRGVNALVKGHLVKTDQPVTAGGSNNAPTPFDLFLASLATCSGIYVKIFCDQRGISTEGIRIFQEMTYKADEPMLQEVNIDIQVPEDFPEKYLTALVSAASKCKVKQHLLQPPEIKVFTTKY